MANLLSELEKKNVRKNYIFRRRVMVQMFISVTFVIAATGLFSLYLFAQSEKESAAILIKNTVQPDLTDETAIRGSLKTINNKLNVFRANNAISVNEFFSTVIKNKSESIKIEGLFFSEKGLTVTGIASTRDTLLRFQRDLEKEPDFSDVTLPVSNFAQDQNIKFTITIQLDSSEVKTETPT